MITLLWLFALDLQT